MAAPRLTPIVKQLPNNRGLTANGSQLAIQPNATTALVTPLHTASNAPIMQWMPPDVPFAESPALNRNLAQLPPLTQTGQAPAWIRLTQWSSIPFYFWESGSEMVTDGTVEFATGGRMSFEYGIEGAASDLFISPSQLSIGEAEDGRYFRERLWNLDPSVSLYELASVGIPLKFYCYKYPRYAYEVPGASNPYYNPPDYATPREFTHLPDTPFVETLQERKEGYYLPGMPYPFGGAISNNFRPTALNQIRRVAGTITLDIAEETTTRRDATCVYSYREEQVTLGATVEVAPQITLRCATVPRVPVVYPIIEYYTMPVRRYGEDEVVTFPPV